MYLFLCNITKLNIIKNIGNKNKYTSRIFEMENEIVNILVITEIILLSVNIVISVRSIKYIIIDNKWKSKSAAERYIAIFFCVLNELI